MSVYQFGSGTLLARRTDVANPTPVILGVLQDVEIDFDQTLKELKGGYKIAVDIASADFKITAKAKAARIQANAYNSLFFGQTLTTASGRSMTIQEAFTVPATPGPYTYQTVGHTVFVHDGGIFYASTFVQLVRVASGPTVGQYSVDETTGTYTFAAADQGVAMLAFYTKTMTTLSQISLVNQLMGSGPAFSVSLQNTYTNNAGVAGNMFFELNACKSSKLTMPFKNTEYLIPEFDFQAFADAAGNVGSISTTE